MSIRRLLITGGAGFIGANFVHYWRYCSPKDEIAVLDALTYAGNRASLGSAISEEKIDFYRGDICDQDFVYQLLVDKKIDTVVHFAAESHVDRSIAGPDAFISANIIGTHSLLKSAHQASERGRFGRPFRFHHVSTDEVYGSLGPQDPPFTELSPYRSNSPYAASKAASDHLVRAYYHTYGLPVTISNCSNNYGPYQFPEKLIPLMLLNALEGRPLPLYGDGRNVRDWLYVEDHCRSIALVLAKGVVGETYNIGGNDEVQNLEVVRLVCGLVDERLARSVDLRERYPESPASKGSSTESLITFVKDRPGHDRRYAIDSSKAYLELGYQPLVKFDVGIRRTLNWYLHNEMWWRSVMDGRYREWIGQHYAR